MNHSVVIQLVISAAVIGGCGSAFADHPTVVFGNEAAGPINTIAATPMPAGSWAAGFRTELVDFDEFSDAKLIRSAEAGIEDVHSTDYLLNASMSLAYGITDDLSVAVRLPWVHRENIREGTLEEDEHDHHHIEGEAHAHGNAAGLGDLVFLANYRAFKTESLDVSMQVGLKAPSGDTDKSDDGERFETELQPGTGSWDFLIGAAMSRSLGRWGLHANVLYNETTEGSQDTEIGNAFFYNAAAVYNLSGGEAHHRHDDETIHDHLRWDVMLEINGEKRWKNEVGGSTEGNSGGDIVYLSPGLRASYKAAGAFISAGYPIVDDTNGVQTDVNFRIVGGVGITF